MDYAACVRELITLGEDSLLAYLELTRDLVFNKIPDEMHHQLIRLSAKVGSEMAKVIKDELRTNIPEAIARILNINVVTTEADNVCGPVTCRSEYIENPPKIVLYQRSISHLERQIIDNNLNDLLVSTDVRPIHIAHELFHHFESTRIGSVSKMYKVDTIKIGFLRISSGVRAMSEIAAHNFAKELLGLRYYPKILDLLFPEEILLQELRTLEELKRIHGARKCVTIDVVSPNSSIPGSHAGCKAEYQATKA